MKKYSIWILNNNSIYSVYAEKVKDTNSSKEVDKYINKGYFGTFYRQEDYINADYLQFFNEY